MTTESGEIRGLTVDESKLARRVVGEIRSGRQLAEFTARELALAKVSAQQQVERHQDGQVRSVRLLGRLVRYEVLVAEKAEKKKKQGRAAER